MTNTDFALTELDRRLANMIRFGCVVATDYGGAVPRVKVAIGELETAWLPMITARADKDSSTWYFILQIRPNNCSLKQLQKGKISQVFRSRIYRTQY